MAVENLQGDNKHLFMLSLSNPVAADRSGLQVVNAKMYVGVNPMDVKDVEDVGLYPFDNETRWAKPSFGFTDPTPCGGAANDDIGAAANQQIGVYNAINAGPGSGGNTPLSSIKIVSRIVFGDHSLFGFPFPNGTNYPQVYNIPTFGTPLQDLHYNDFAIQPDFPDWNCLSNVELINFTFGNLSLAANGYQFVPPFGSIPRTLVCTGVGAFFGGANTPGTNQTEIELNFQDHPTRHYFGLVVTVEVPDGDLEDM